MRIIGQVIEVDPNTQQPERFNYGDVLTVCTSYERLLLMEVDNRWGKDGAERMMHLLRSMTTLDDLLKTLNAPPETS